MRRCYTAVGIVGAVLLSCELLASGSPQGGDTSIQSPSKLGILEKLRQVERDVRSLDVEDASFQLSKGDSLGIIFSGDDAQLFFDRMGYTGEVEGIDLVVPVIISKRTERASNLISYSVTADNVRFKNQGKSISWSMVGEVAYENIQAGGRVNVREISDLKVTWKRMPD